jgi:hypothetical protein
MRMDIMKDAYVVLNYTALEKDLSSDMSPFLVEYVKIKKTVAKSGGDIGKVFGMNDKDALTKAVQFIRERLSDQNGARVKILVGGHGQYNQSGGIVLGGASGVDVGVPAQQIVDDISQLVKPFSGRGIEWSVKLCVCFAGRPTDDYARAIDKNSNVDSSMAASVAKGLSLKGVRDFTLKAYFTPVSINKSTGHLEATPEVHQQHKFALIQGETTAQQRFPRGFEFWKPENEDEALLWSMSCSYAYTQLQSKPDITNVFDMEVYKSFKLEFLLLAEMDARNDPDLVKSLNRRAGEQIVDEILWYRLVQLVCSEYGGSSLQKANKVVWTCKGGQLKHQILDRE